MTSNPFNHGLSNKDTDEIFGYLRCLRNIYTYLAEATEFNPQKRMVDAVDILGKIESTSSELSGLLAKAQETITTNKIS